MLKFLRATKKKKTTPSHPYPEKHSRVLSTRAHVRTLTPICRDCLAHMVRAEVGSRQAGTVNRGSDVIGGGMVANDWAVSFCLPAARRPCYAWRRPPNCNVPRTPQLVARCGNNSAYYPRPTMTT